MRVYTLSIEHKHGIDTFVFTKEKLLDDFLYGWVKNWWDDEMKGKKMPKSKDKAIKEYFDYRCDRTIPECYSTDTVDVNPKYGGHK